MVRRVEKHDEILIESAKKIIENLYQEGKHHVGAAVRTKSGKIFTAVNLEAYIGRVAVCAEAIVIGKAISEGENEFETIVAVLSNDEGTDSHVVSPCGICRELISDYGEDIEIILQEEQEHFRKIGVLELLPNKYKRA